MMPFRLSCLALALALAACQPAPPGPDRPSLGAEAPPGAAPGTCWGKKDTPAVIETVTEQVQLSPAETDATGRVLRPATYATVTRQAILRERVTTWYETPCPDVQTPEFIASVQRALAARGLYTGQITARFDARTWGWWPRRSPTDAVALFNPASGFAWPEIPRGNPGSIRDGGSAPSPQPCP